MTKILETIDVNIAEIKPNSWNPNKQTARQFEAEVESILNNGFVMPLIVRKVDDVYEIVDGEHRYKALSMIIEEQQTGAFNIDQIVATQQVPVTVLDITEAEAKKLTIILNETRGRADVAELSALLLDLENSFGDTLIEGLPYLEGELEELLSMADYDWDSFVQVTEEDFDTHANDVTDEYVAMHFKLDDETVELWREECRKANISENDAVANGELLRTLILSQQEQ